MTKRWMKAIIDTSKAEAPMLPYHRAARQAYKADVLAPVKSGVA